MTLENCLKLVLIVLITKTIDFELFPVNMTPGVVKMGSEVNQILPEFFSLYLYTTATPSIFDIESWGKMQHPSADPNLPFNPEGKLKKTPGFAFVIDQGSYLTS